MSSTIQSSPSLTSQPLPNDLTKEFLNGAEMVLNSDVCQLPSPSNLTSEDISAFRQALYDYSVLVIKKQSGIEPNVFPQPARIWDENTVEMHSGGSKL